MQVLHMNRLNSFLKDSLSLRFDHGLQATKATFRACRVFLQCGKCVKDSSNLLLTISALNLTLQLFELWISRETSWAPRAEPGVDDIRYGYYEACSTENRQIRLYLLRGLLLQCRDVLALLKMAINTVRIEVPKPIDSEDSIISSMTTDESANQIWTLSGQSVNAESNMDSEAPKDNAGNSCLLPIIAGYEATIEAFLQSASMNGCICRLNVANDEPL